MGNFVKFHQNTWKCLNWNFDGILLESDAKFQEEFTCEFKIDSRNLTNFDPGTRKSQKFAF